MITVSPSESNMPHIIRRLKTEDDITCCGGLLLCDGGDGLSFIDGFPTNYEFYEK